MTLAEKAELKQVKKIFKKPPEDVLLQIKGYKYCPQCDYVGVTKICPKDNTDMKRVLKTNAYYYGKAKLKAMLEDEVISKDQIHRLNLTLLYR